MGSKIKAIQILQAAGYILLGLFLGLTAFWNGAALIGGLLILAGLAVFSAAAYGLLHVLQCRKGKAKGELILGVIFIALGVFCLITPQTVVSFLPFLLGVVLMLDGISKIQRALDLRVLDAIGWGKLLTIGILLMIVGVALLFNPFGAVKMTMVFFGACLLIDGALDLLFLLIVL